MLLISNRIRRGIDFCREVTLLQFDALTVPCGINEGRYLGENCEHQQQPYGGQYATVYHTNRRNKKTSNDEHQADCKRNVEGFHTRNGFSGRLQSLKNLLEL